MVAAAAIAGGVASAATGSLLNSALGSSPNIPLSQNGGGRGLNSALSGTFAIDTPGANILELNPGQVISSPGSSPDYLNSLFAPQIFGADTAYQNLQNQVNPAFSDITAARVNAIQNAIDKATSDLRGNLAQRRVLGSSFGQDALARVQLEGGQQIGAARAQGQLESIDAMQKLLQARVSNMAQLVTQEMNQSQFQTSAAINLINGTQQTFSDNAAVLGQLAAANASGIGAAAQPIASAVGSGVQKLVNNYFSTPSVPQSYTNLASGSGGDTVAINPYLSAAGT